MGLIGNNEDSFHIMDWQKQKRLKRRVQRGQGEREAKVTEVSRSRASQFNLANIC